MIFIVSQKNLINIILQKKFHTLAKKPNEKWLTDITEFHIPAGKIYLSPIIDCFDGMVVSWTIGTSPNSKLANTMLQKAIEQLDPSEHPLVHSDCIILWNCHNCSILSYLAVK